jgi:hypothetical protein
VDARSLSTYTAVAAVPAAVVILGHLAWVWNQHPSSSDRQAAAFDHGLAVAAILAATLAAGRIALWMEGRARYPWADTLAVIGSPGADVGHLAVAWRDEGVGDVSVAVVHAAALGALAVVVNIARAFEEPRAKA